jgi:hypothetical protein
MDFEGMYLLFFHRLNKNKTIETQKRNHPLVKWKCRATIRKGEVSLYIQYTMDQLCLPMDFEEDIPGLSH